MEPGGVSIKGLTVQNGTADGITGQRGAAFTVHSTTVQNNADEGIQIGENSTADLTDCTVRDNGEGGILVFGSSNVDFRGANVVNGNATAGIFIDQNSNALFITGTVQVYGNDSDGLLITHTSHVATSRRGAPTLTITNNGRDGILPLNGGSLQTAGTLTTASNGRHGITVVLGPTLYITDTTAALRNNTQAGLNVGVSSKTKKRKRSNQRNCSWDLAIFSYAVREPVELFLDYQGALRPFYGIIGPPMCCITPPALWVVDDFL